LPTTKRIAQFSSGREPKPGDRIVYVDGAFDLFRILYVGNWQWEFLVCLFVNGSVVF